MRGSPGQQVQPVAANNRGYVNIADFLNANKHILEQENQLQRKIQIQQQKIEGTRPPRQVHFDEEEIEAYDLQRGQCQVIDDPKTPFHEEASDEEMDLGGEMNDSAQQSNEQIALDPLTQHNLSKAQQNKMLNAETKSGVRR